MSIEFLHLVVAELQKKAEELTQKGDKAETNFEVYYIQASTLLIIATAFASAKAHEGGKAV